MHYVPIFRKSWSMFLTPEKKADLTISTLKNCRNEFNFTNIWGKTKFISQNVKRWIKKDVQESDEIQLKEPCIPQGCTFDLESYRVNFF